MWIDGRLFPVLHSATTPHLLKTQWRPSQNRHLNTCKREKADDHLHPVETRWVDKVVECNINLFVEYESFHQTNKWDNVNKWSKWENDWKQWRILPHIAQVSLWRPEMFGWVWPAETAKTETEREELSVWENNAFTILWKLYCCHQ